VEGIDSPDDARPLPPQTRHPVDRVHGARQRNLRPHRPHLLHHVHTTPPRGMRPRARRPSSSALIDQDVPAEHLVERLYQPASWSTAVRQGIACRGPTPKSGWQTTGPKVEGVYQPPTRRTRWLGHRSALAPGTFPTVPASSGCKRPRPASAIPDLGGLGPQGDALFVTA